jgi:hypothetical protein
LQKKVLILLHIGTATPILAAMVKNYLTDQASSVAAERGTDLATSDRFSLDWKTVDMTQFLKFSFNKK